MLTPDADLKIKFTINGKQKFMIVKVNNGVPSVFKGFEARTITSEDLLSYTGTFYSPELETSYKIYLEKDTLFYHHARHGDFEMKVLKHDVLESEWPVSITKYKRDKKGSVTGINVSNDRVRNLCFEKQKYN